MDSRTMSRVREWESHPFDGGYAGLRALADSSFSGALVSAPALLFMLNGRIIGVFDGTIETFETADAVAYVAPDPSLPLLFTMLELDGETRAQYYTEDTPISEVHETLQSGSFTGYIELSENVLSGDYYVLYQAGRSMSVGFVGSSERLVTDDEAFNRADDEVGIYSVNAVELSVIDIPSASADSSPVDESAAPSADDETVSDQESEQATPREHDDADPASDSAGTEPNPAEEAEIDTESSSPEAPAVREAESGSSTSEPPEERQSTPDRQPNPTSSADVPNSAFEAEKQWRETKTIPSLDPGTNRDSSSGSVDNQSTGRSTSTPVSEPSEPATTAIEQQLAARNRELSEARSELQRLEAERDAVAAERDELRDELTALRERIEHLESEREQLASGDGASVTGPTTSLSVSDALDGTNLFIRYASKGAPTLENAHRGDAESDTVNDNLRIEYHTGFDESMVEIDGESFEPFLHDRIEYRFVQWLVRDLLYEIQSTGHVSGLGDLYDAIPAVDRAELRGEVSLRFVEDGEEHRQQHRFDIVIRDRMGHPLFVIDIKDSREPAGEDEMADLVKAAIRTKESEDFLAGAFLVTSSFFGPGALETAAEATSSGFLSGGSRESFVKLSRKRGFHLCLVEARDGGFHIAVPEL